MILTLERVSDWAEASDIRASGQFGFRRQRGTAHAALVLRTLQDQHRAEGQQLWACFVDFRKAYDSVPRQRLWDKLAASGMGGSWLRAVQALYADVPMAVRTTGGLSPCFQARLGLKQGCPLSPTLFGLYIDDLEATMLAAAQRGARLDLPWLRGSGGMVPPLLYADDTTLLATSADGLQRQLDLLQQYCEQWGLTVNAAKTKLVLLSGQRTQQAAVDTAQRAALSLAGQPLEAVSSFRYLGITFHASSCIAGAAAPARAVAARAAMHSCNARCAALGVEAAPLQLRLFSTMVDAVLSYGSEVWGMQLAAASAAGKTSSTAGSKAERLHLAHLRRLLGVRQGTPTAVVLAEAGERPLWQRWVLRAVKLWNLAVTAEQSSLLWQAVTASVALAGAPGHRIPARQPWAQQLAAALAAMGVQLDLHQPQPVCKAAVQSACSAWQLKQLQDAATREGASKLQHYTQGVWGGTLDTASLGTRAAYLTVVRERSRRAPLAQLRTGSHWGAEETGRWDKTPPEQRLCSHCSGGVETVQHIIFDCPLYASLRTRFSDLFCLLPEPRTLHAFFQQPPARLATFAASLKLQWQVAHDAAVLL
ncbi:Retrovirus-related Pol polyprotein from type-2 retrotransposable element R2DM [Chlorella vulgaris]